jgi:hypothetical protein
MKNEKMKLLLNKVVNLYRDEKVENLAFKQTTLNCKGFLYKDEKGYYIKVVEVEKGSVDINDKVRLVDSDENNVTFSAKPKLMRVSLKSWHYRLIKFVLRNNAPTPQTMQNGCPYFWLLIFAIFACSFVALWKAVKTIVLLIPKLFLSLLKKSVDAWILSLDDVEAYDMYMDEKDSQKMPVTAKIFMDAKDENFFSYFLDKRYGLNKVTDTKAYQEKTTEIYAEWQKFRNAAREKRAKLNAEQTVKENIKREKLFERERKREANQVLWEARIKPFSDGIVKLFTSIRQVFTIKGDTKNLIKRTKQIVGALVTVVLLIAAFLLVETLAFILIAFIDFSVTNWYLYAGLGGIAIFAGLIYVIGVFVGSWLQKIVNKYKSGKKIWYIEPLIYLFWYPAKYIFLFIMYALLYVIWIPIKYIFYKFLWNTVLVNLGILIWKGLCAFGRGLVNSTGVFGEYFGASYSDYCPGIEWVDEEQK